MGPVDDPSIGIRLKDPVELDHVSDLEADNPGGDIDIVCDQQGLSGGQLEDEFLVAGPDQVIRQDARDYPGIRRQPEGGILLPIPGIRAAIGQESPPPRILPELVDGGKRHYQDDKELSHFG